MYKMMRSEGVIRIPPDRLGENIQDVIKDIARLSFEGKINNTHELTLIVTDIQPEGEGRILHSDGGVYQKVYYDALIFKPEPQEIVEGTVVEILKYGAFMRFGPLDGLLHISQIMDDHIDVDQSNERLVGKETKRDLKVNDRVRARIVAISINERNPRDSKIGLTMRQVGLGKLDWMEEERRPPKEDDGKAKKGKGKKGKAKK